MNRLKKQRRMLGMTQHQLADAARIAPGRIAFWETGRVRLKTEELQRVKDALARRRQKVVAAVAVPGTACDLERTGKARLRATSAPA